MAAADTGGAKARPASHSVAVAVAAGEGVLTVVLYAVGWGRAFSSDASRTVQQFVAVDSLGDVFRQDRFNNQPLFSFVDHLVYLATHSTDERLLRVAPLVFAGLTVGIVAHAVARRFGAAAGAVAGATLTVNALTARHFREVRGYSLVSLAAIVATLALFKRTQGQSARTTAVYTAAMAVATGTHLYAFALLVLHVIIVLSTERRCVRTLLGPWAVAAGVGLLVQAPALMDAARRPPIRDFNPTFPLALGANFLSGGPAIPAVLLLVISGWVMLRSRPWVVWTVTGIAFMAVAAWVAAPASLSPRYFTWLMPATAVAAGVGVAQRPRLVYVAAAGVLAQLVFLGPQLTASEVPNRIAAGFVRDAQKDGLSVSAMGRTRGSLRAYAADVPVAWEVHDLAQCDVAVEAAGPNPQPLLSAACERFAYVLELPARHPGALFADSPRPLADEHVAEAPRNASGWTQTTGAALCEEATRP